MGLQRVRFNAGPDTTAELHAAHAPADSAKTTSRVRRILCSNYRSADTSFYSSLSANGEGHQLVDI